MPRHRACWTASRRICGRPYETATSTGEPFMTRVLVTGGSGFIGSNLTDRLLAEGHEVTGVDDMSTGKLHDLPQARRHPALPLSFQRVDITSSALDRVMAKAEPEIVLHLAAQIDVRRSVEDPVHDAMVNIVGTVNLLET